jgi:hypothetical protein
MKMKISKEIYESHRKLSECSARFLDFIDIQPEIMNRSNFSALASDKTFAYFRNQPWPTFINGRTRSKMEEAAINIYSLITSVPERLFDFDYRKIGRYYNFSENDTEMMFHGVSPFHMSGLLGRGDFVICPDGGLKCLEYNLTSSLGGWGMDFVESIYLNTGVIAEFIKKYNVRLRKNHLFATLFEQLVERSLKQFGDTPQFHGEINIAIAFPQYNERIFASLNAGIRQMYKQYLEKEKSGLNGDVILCDLKMMSLNMPDKALRINGKRIHVLIELCDGEMPLIYMELVRSGNLLLHNGPITPLMSNKFHLALLSEFENSEAFSPAEREDIRTYIPWTRRLVPCETTYKGEKIKMEDFIISSRERLVIKPSKSFGGKGVLLGFNTTPERWKHEVEKALSERNHVVQEYIPSNSYMYQVGENGCSAREAVFGCFIFCSRYAGGFVRMLPEADNEHIINAGQGAEESIILEVEE